MSMALVLVVPFSDGFNLDVDNPTHFRGSPDSFFGYSVDFYLPGHVGVGLLIGAPKDNTSQPDIFEGGAVHYCSWSQNSNLNESSCQQIKFNSSGNRVTPESGNSTEKEIMESKSSQWFGASVRSHKDTILACAPLYSWRTHSKNISHFDPVGTCYLSVKNFSKIVEYSPCRSDIGTREGQGFCQGGFSAAFSKNGTVVLGGPGSYYWQGQVITASPEQIVKGYYPDYFILPIDGQMTRQAGTSYDDSYLGYSVAVGEFNGDSVEDIVAGVPRGKLTYGYATILNGTNLESIYNFTGEQMASYFGYAVAATDLNNDGLDDLLVGAPMYMEKTMDGRLQEVGRVYIYLQNSWQDGNATVTLTGNEEFGRFGSSISPLGDLDQDGYNDVAISTPFGGEDRQGIVSIYNGKSGGLRDKPSQILRGQWARGRLPACFGFAMRGNRDIDRNGYPDLIVGAFGADAATLYRSRPIVYASASLTISPSMVNPEEKACLIKGTELHVSCFNLSFCLNASGKHVPHSIGFQVELQLDSMKQKGAVKRALFLDSRQAQRLETIHFKNSAGEMCRDLKVYLREESEFRDKLSQIHIAMNFSLDPQAPADKHGMHPILNYQTKNVLEQKAQILLGCGEDNICVPDLKIHVSGHDKVYHGDDNAIALLFDAKNDGEGGAYEAELYVTLPPEAEYSGIVRDSEQLSILQCAYETENQTRLVICDLGNPMKAGTQVSGGLRFTVPHLRNGKDTVKFEFQIRSKNQNNSQSAIVEYDMQVVVKSQVLIRGVSRPERIEIPLHQKLIKNPVKEQDIGPELQHIYELGNEGPSSISQTLLELSCPLKFQGSDLLYPIEYITQGPINCTSNTPVNPQHFKTSHRPTADTPTLRSQVDHHVQKRDAHEEHEEHSEEEMLSCPKMECLKLRCTVGLLERRSSVILKVRSRIWMATFLQEESPGNKLLQCKAEYKVQNMPYSLQPKEYPYGEIQVVTTIARAKSEKAYAVPLWIIILAVLAGLLLLALLVYALYKVGFFKRTMPYGTAMEKAQLKPQAASEA